MRSQHAHSPARSITIALTDARRYSTWSGDMFGDGSTIHARLLKGR